MLSTYIFFLFTSSTNVCQEAFQKRYYPVSIVDDMFPLCEGNMISAAWPLMSFPTNISAVWRSNGLARNADIHVYSVALSFCITLWWQYLKRWLQNIECVIQLINLIVSYFNSLEIRETTHHKIPEIEESNRYVNLSLHKRCVLFYHCVYAGRSWVREGEAG